MVSVGSAADCSSKSASGRLARKQDLPLIVCMWISSNSSSKKMVYAEATKGLPAFLMDDTDGAIDGEATGDEKQAAKRHKQAVQDGNVWLFFC